MTLRAPHCDQMLLQVIKDYSGGAVTPALLSSAEENEGGTAHKGSLILGWAPQLCYYVIRKEGL